MANNPENVEPYKIRTAEEARAKGRAGGLRSGVKRREKASLREAARLILSMDSVSPKLNKAMELMGLDGDERTNAAAITAVMMMKAADGDVKAYEALSRNMAPLDADAAAAGALQAASEASIPHFDLSANISPTFCSVSREIERGAQEVILKGGRGSTKSSYAYQKQLDVFLSRPNAMWLCLRQYANTLRRSCFANVMWAIRKRGMTLGRTGEKADFTLTVAPMEITYNRTGQKIVFSGLDDPEKLKSITFDDPEKKIEILTFEEYSQFRSPRDVRNVEWSVLRSDYGLVVKLFNPPPDEMHWANVEAREKAGDGSAVVHHSTWRDVPREFLGKRFVDAAERMYRENPAAARNELDGETVELTGRVFPNVEDQELSDDIIAGFKWIRRGLDWGYEGDPWGMWDVAYDRKGKALYIFGEEIAYHKRNEVTAAIAKEHLAERDPDGRVSRTDDGEPIVRRIPSNEVRCDIAERKSIADFRALGIDAKGASKAVPVIDGIRWLQNRRRIVIDRRRAPFAYQEFSRYCADTDDEGRFKGYPDKDNHSIDGVRYAVFDLISDPDIT